MSSNTSRITSALQGGEYVSKTIKTRIVALLHRARRLHTDSSKDELPVRHVLSKTPPLAEKLIMDLVEVTPTLRKPVEIGAVVSFMMEGLQHHHEVVSTLITEGPSDGKALFYAEWKPNHSEKVHRYLIVVRGEFVYVGYFPWDGRKPCLYGIHHKKQDVITLLHKTNDPLLRVPELTLLTEINIPNITFELVDPSPIGAHVTISHKGGSFYTRSIYGEFVSFESCVLERDDIPQNTEMDVICAEGKPVKAYPNDSTGYNMNDPKHPRYMFWGATGYVQLCEGKMFCYPDGSIRFLTREQEDSIFRGYTDMQIVQGDLVCYKGDVSMPMEINDSQAEFRLGRHNIKADKVCLVGWSTPDPSATNPYQQRVYVLEDCTIIITHPEHGEVKYEARKGEMLALLPGTSHPFQKYCSSSLTPL